MPGLLEQIQSSLRGRICFVGLGNVDGGDDGFGVRLAEALAGAGVPDVIIAGNEPENLPGHRLYNSFDHLVFLDAVDFGAEPGSVVFLNSSEISARYSEFSTHKISLGLLVKYIESEGMTRAWLLGAQPESLRRSPALSPALQSTLAVLTDLIGIEFREGVKIC